MDTSLFYLVGTALLLSTLVLVLFTGRRHRRDLHQPPTISGSLPILGHLHLILAARLRHQPLHRALAALSAAHGPVLLLRFGSRPILSISSPSAAADCLTTNDITFSDRPVLLPSKHLCFNKSTMSTSSYGPHWRSLRRIATVGLFSTARIQFSAHLRAEAVRSLLTSLLFSSAAAGEWTPVDMKRKFKMLTFDSMMRIVDGRKYCGEGESMDFELGEGILRMVKEAFLLSDTSSVEDFVPWMGWFGMGGLKRRMMKLGKEMDEIFQEMVDERRRRRKADVSPEMEKITMLEVMLAMQEEEPVKYDDRIIKGMISMIPLAKKFRYAGIAPELEEKLDSMFNQVVATGGNVWIPSMGAMPSLFADEVVMIDEDNNIGHGDDILDSPTKVKVPKKIGKRKKSEKGTKQEILSRMDDLVESSRSVSSRITTPVVPPSLLLLEEAVDEIEKHEEICGDPAFYDFATVFLLTTVNRGMFLKLPLHKRVTWLRNRFNQSTGRSG